MPWVSCDVVSRGCMVWSTCVHPVGNVDYQENSNPKSKYMMVNYLFINSNTLIVSITSEKIEQRQMTFEQQQNTIEHRQ